MTPPFTITETASGLWIAERTVEPTLCVIQTSLERLLAVLPLALARSDGPASPEAVISLD